MAHAFSNARGDHIRVPHPVESAATLKDICTPPPTRCYSCLEPCARPLPVVGTSDRDGHSRAFGVVAYVCDKDECVKALWSVADMHEWSLLRTQATYALLLRVMTWPQLLMAVGSAPEQLRTELCWGAPPPLPCVEEVPWQPHARLVHGLLPAKCRWCKRDAHRPLPLVGAVEEAGGSELFVVDAVVCGWGCLRSMLGWVRPFELLARSMSLWHRLGRRCHDVVPPMPTTVTLGPQALEAQFSGATESVTTALERDHTAGAEVVRNVSAILTGASGGRVVAERQTAVEADSGPTLLHSMMEID